MSREGVFVSAGHVASLRGYVARASALLAEAEELAKSHDFDPEQVERLLRQRDGVLGELAGYLARVLDQAPAGRELTGIGG